MQKEIWKEIPGYEGVYKVSSIGNVKSLKFSCHRILVPTINSSGYYKVNLYKEGVPYTYRVHQLVAMSYLNHTPDGLNLVVNHKDFDKLNNNFTNLEIVTNRENSNQKHIKSTSKYVGVSWHRRSKKWYSVIVVGNDHRYLGTYKEEFDAHIAYEKALQNL